MRKKLPFIKTNLNAEFTSKDMEHPKGISETVPDMSWTIRELLEKWTITHPELMLKNNPYDHIEDLDFDIEDDFRQFKDITEAQEYADALNSKIEKERANLAQNKKLSNYMLKSRSGDVTQTRRSNDITDSKKLNEVTSNDEGGASD